VRFLVDSGALYSVLPRVDWKALGLKANRDLGFVLADGTSLTRGVNEAVFELEGRRATSPVVLGETEDEALLGAVTLETLGLMLNPLNRTLQPMRLSLRALLRRDSRLAASQDVFLNLAGGRLWKLFHEGHAVRRLEVCEPLAHEVDQLPVRR
jgi:predicted aspartyl protease